MDSLKSIVVLAVLVAAGVGLYRKINGSSDPLPPVEISGPWSSPPQVEFSGPKDGLPTSQVPDGERPGPAVVPPSSPAADSANFAVAGSPGSGANPSTGASVGETTSGPTSLSRVASIPYSRAFRSSILPNPQQRSPLLPSRLTAAPQQDALVDVKQAGKPSGSNSTGKEGGALANRSMSGQVDSVDRYARTIPELPHSAPFSQVTGPTAERLDLFEATCGAAHTALQGGQLTEAHRILSRWYGEPGLSARDEQNLNELLSQLAGSVIYSNEHHMAPAHVVESGETPGSLAQKYGVPWQLLAKINGIFPSEQLQVGRELKVIHGPFHAIIHLDRRELILMLHDYYAGRFTIGVGVDQKDMQGQWVVEQKLTNPIYYGPERVIAADDPDNPLGKRWIGLTKAVTDQATVPIGIHGTNDPASVTSQSPRGFICLGSQDVQDVYDILSIGSKVTIRR